LYDFNQMPKLTASSARQNFSDIVNRAAYGRERIIVHRRKKPIAAVIPIEDLELLEKLEDEIDLKAAREALKEPGTIPWETIKKKLRL
jgi:prevent-host-death family protein